MTDTITIPKAEYDRLVEASEAISDLETIERFKAKLARGEEELIPAEYVDRILDGESPLKVWREYRGLTQQKLASLSGVNRVQIGDIETRGKAGSVETFKKLAAVLNVTVDDLV